MLLGIMFLRVLVRILMSLLNRLFIIQKDACFQIAFSLNLISLIDPRSVVSDDIKIYSDSEEDKH